MLALLAAPLGCTLAAAQLLAGVAKVDITDRAAGPVNGPSYVKALVVKGSSATLVLKVLNPKPAD